MKAETLNERPQNHGAGLSTYELALMRMIVEERTLAQMAEELASSRAAVNRQLALVRFKLGVTTDLQAADVARARGWI